MVDFKMFGIGVMSLSRLMDSNNCFSQIIADVFGISLWLGVNTRLNALDYKHSKRLPL